MTHKLSDEEVASTMKVADEILQLYDAGVLSTDGQDNTHRLQRW